MKVSRSALLPYSAAQMYGVIIDVGSYPEFLNWCHGAEIVSESTNEVVAKLVIRYGKLDFSFITRNTMRRDESVMINLVDGPFSSLQGFWNIQALTNKACKVSIDMAFSFESKLTQKVFGRVFQKVISAQLEAFQKRAEHIHGKSNA